MAIRSKSAGARPETSEVRTTRMTTPWATTMIDCAAMPTHEILDDRYHAAADVGVRFAARMGVFHITGDPAFFHGGVSRPAFVTRFPAQETDLAFVQAGDWHWVQVARPTDDRGCNDGPLHRRRVKWRSLVAGRAIGPVARPDRLPNQTGRRPTRHHEIGRERTFRRGVPTTDGCLSNVLLLAMRGRRWWTIQASFHRSGFDSGMTPPQPQSRRSEARASPGSAR